MTDKLYSRDPSFGVVVSEDVMVKMADGVHLATDIYRPALPDGSPAPEIGRAHV